MLFIAKPPQSSCMSELSRDDHMPAEHYELTLSSPGSPAGESQPRHGRNVPRHPVGSDWWDALAEFFDTSDRKSQQILISGEPGRRSPAHDVATPRGGSRSGPASAPCAIRRRGWSAVSLEGR